MLFAALLVVLSMVRARAGVGLTLQGDFVLLWATRLLVVLAAALRWFELRIPAAIAGAAFLAVIGLRGWQLFDAGLRPTTSPTAAVLTVVLALYALHALVASFGLLGRRAGWRLLWLFLAVLWLTIDAVAFVW